MGEGQFVRLPYELIDSGRLTSTELTVYIALLRHRDHQTGRCWPSYATLAQEARVSRRTAISAVKSLEEQGIVKIYPDAHKANVYEVALFSKFPKPPKGDSHPVDNPVVATNDSGAINAPGGENAAPGGETISPGWCNLFTGSGANAAPELEPQTSSTEREPENENHELAITPDVPSGEHTEFSFEVDPPKRASGKQVTCLHDLYILQMWAEAPASQQARWREFTTTEADQLIKSWMRAIPTGESYIGPECGDEIYNRLSTQGQDFADNKFLPLDVSA